MSRPTKPEQVLMQFKVPRDLHVALRIYALEHGETMSEVGSFLIEQYLREQGRYPMKREHAGAATEQVAQPA